MDSTTQSVEPTRYNIVLTKDGEPIEFEIEPALPKDIMRLGYLKPFDDRCVSTFLTEDKDLNENKLYTTLTPVLGTNYRGHLEYHTSKTVIVSVHDTSVLGYQRQRIVDPRINNTIANLWEVFIDTRLLSIDSEWKRELLLQTISLEIDDSEADVKLAETIKARILASKQGEG